MSEKQAAIARLIIIILAVVNQSLTIAGYNPLPFSDETLYEAITALFTGYAVILAWWKNNNVTPEAQKAQNELNRLKGRE